MQEWNIEEIRAEICEYFVYCEPLKICVDKLFFETTDTHVLDVIGESSFADKVKCGKLWRIEGKDDAFTMQETNILYAGEIIEREVFFMEDYVSGMENGNQKYMEAVQALEEKSRAYEWELPQKDPLGYVPHSFVVIEKRADGIPVVKWMTLEHVYAIDEQFKGKTANLKDIGELVSGAEVVKTMGCDLNRILYLDSYYQRTKHLTKVHVEGKVKSILYDGEEKIHSINRVYEGFGEFLEVLQHFVEDLKKDNLKKRWYRLADMDIDVMDELASLITMEIYFAKGYKGILERVSNEDARWTSDGLVGYLHSRESLEDYIGALICGLDEEFGKKVRAVFGELKNNDILNLQDLVYTYIKPHLNGRYEVGKVYFAKVIKESLKENGAEMDGLVQLYDEASHIKFVEKLLWGEYVFMDATLRDYPYIIQAEYGRGPCWSGDTVLDAYLKDNIYEERGRLRPHGWQDEIIPVRIVGYGEQRMPIVEYAGAWH